MQIVIIEDEKLTADDLAATILSVEPETRIIASLRSVKEAIAYLKGNAKADLIFSDIQLGDGLSFEIFKAVDIAIPVIFCTAYDEYALNAFNTNGIDYILKPFTAKTIREALDKYNHLKQTFSNNQISYEAVLKALMKEAAPQTTHILIHHKEKILPVKMDDVALFFVENEMTRLLTFDKKTYSADKNLEDLEQIAGNAFFRVNRQCLINRRAVVDASRYFSRKLSVNLTVPFKETITVSKEKTPLFLNWLQGG
jgi:two-component system, LytTR family, response regulator LytT